MFTIPAKNLSVGDVFYFHPDADPVRVTEIRTYPANDWPTVNPIYFSLVPANDGDWCHPYGAMAPNRLVWKD